MEYHNTRMEVYKRTSVEDTDILFEAEVLNKFALSV